MGFDCELKNHFTIQYQAEMNNSIIENEIDHVFSGIYDQDPSPNPVEVSEFSWVDPNSLINDVRNKPEIYSYWFKLLLEKVIN